MQVPGFALTFSFISVVVFIFACYDTLQGHLFTHTMNEWVLQVIYVSPEASGKWAHLYYESLLGITALGSNIILCMLLLVIFSDLIYRKEIRALFYNVTAVVIIFILAEICKHVIESPRPMFPLEPDSFPSGHTVRVGIGCGMLLLLNQLKVVNIAYCWRVLLWVMPLLVAFTRLGLGRHWLSDVMASLALCGGVFLWLGYVASRNTR